MGIKSSLQKIRKSFKAIVGPVRQLMASEQSSPAFMIIGAQKAGTTALHAYLNKHPKIRPPAMKEIRFFSHEHRFERGERFYKSHFPVLKTGEVTYDASPVYMYHPVIAERLHRFNPDLKLIAVLRDPVERAFSQWNMYRQMMSSGTDELFPYASPRIRKGLMSLYGDNGILDFEKCVRLEMEIEADIDEVPEPSLLRRGLYYDQLKRFFDLFGRDNVKVVESNELKTDTQQVVDELTRFIGLEPHSLLDVQKKPVHVRKYESKIDEEIRGVWDLRPVRW